MLRTNAAWGRLEERPQRAQQHLRLAQRAQQHLRSIFDSLILLLHGSDGNSEDSFTHTALPIGSDGKARLCDQSLTNETQPRHWRLAANAHGFTTRMVNKART